MGKPAAGSAQEAGLRPSGDVQGYGAGGGMAAITWTKTQPKRHGAGAGRGKGSGAFCPGSRAGRRSANRASEVPAPHDMAGGGGPLNDRRTREDAVECVKCLDHQWSNGVRDECIPKPVLFLSYKEPLGAALVIICAIFSAITLSTLCILMRHRDTPIVRASNRGLSFLLLVSLILCFLCSIIFIGKPKRVTCVLRQVVFAIVFTICISTILAKTITVIIAFNATRPGSIFRKWVKPTFPFYLLLLCSLPQVVICIMWLVISPPFVELNMKSEIGTITIECNEGSFILFYGALGYLGLLSSISFVVAFIARKLPNSFNEGKMITFSMLVFCSVWILFIPTYLSTRGKYIVAEEIFAIQASGAGLLCCIFFPKMYIILLKPERNSKEHLIKKN